MRRPRLLAFWLVSLGTLGSAAGAAAMDGVGVFDSREGVFRAFADLGAPLRVALDFDAGRDRSVIEPVAGDWDGDGNDELALFAPKSRRLAIFADLEGGAPERVLDLTLAAAAAAAKLLPAAGDWDGDGDDELALFEPGSRRLHVFADLADGLPDAELAIVHSDPRTKLLPVAGDWDGDGDDELAFYDAATRVFLMLADLEDGTPDAALALEVRSRKLRPIAGDWDGDGEDDLGVVLRGGRRYLLLADREDGLPDLELTLDAVHAAGKPVAGHWGVTMPEDVGGTPPIGGAFCDAVASWDASLAAFEADVRALVNLRRKQPRSCGALGTFAAAPPLTESPALRCAARRHSLDMAQRGYFSHTSPEGNAPWHRASDAGYSWSAIGENIALGHPTPEGVVAAWLASDGHCANLMSPEFREIGVGVALRASSGQLVWTQLFASPR